MADTIIVDGKTYSGSYTGKSIGQKYIDLLKGSKALSLVDKDLTKISSKELREIASGLGIKWNAKTTNETLYGQIRSQVAQRQPEAKKRAERLQDVQKITKERVLKAQNVLANKIENEKDLIKRTNLINRFVTVSKRHAHFFDPNKQAKKNALKNFSEQYKKEFKNRVETVQAKIEKNLKADSEPSTVKANAKNLLSFLPTPKISNKMALNSAEIEDALLEIEIANERMYKQLKSYEGKTLDWNTYVKALQLRARFETSVELAKQYREKLHSIPFYNTKFFRQSAFDTRAELIKRQFKDKGITKKILKDLDTKRDTAQVKDTKYGQQYYKWDDTAKTLGSTLDTTKKIALKEGTFRKDHGYIQYERTPKNRVPYYYEFNNIIDNLEKNRDTATALYTPTTSIQDTTKRHKYDALLDRVFYDDGKKPKLNLYGYSPKIVNQGTIPFNERTFKRDNTEKFIKNNDFKAFNQINDKLSVPISKSDWDRLNSKTKTFLHLYSNNEYTFQGEVDKAFSDIYSRPTLVDNKIVYLKGENKRIYKFDKYLGGQIDGLFKLNFLNKDYYKQYKYLVHDTKDIISKIPKYWDSYYGGEYDPLLYEEIKNVGKSLFNWQTAMYMGAYTGSLMAIDIPFRYSKYKPSDFIDPLFALPDLGKGILFPTARNKAIAFYELVDIGENFIPYSDINFNIKRVMDMKLPIYYAPRLKSGDITNMQLKAVDKFQFSNSDYTKHNGKIKDIYMDNIAKYWDNKFTTVLTFDETVGNKFVKNQVVIKKDGTTVRTRWYDNIKEIYHNDVNLKALKYQYIKNGEILTTKNIKDPKIVTTYNQHMRTIVQSIIPVKKANMKHKIRETAELRQIDDYIVKGNVGKKQIFKTNLQVLTKLKKRVEVNHRKEELHNNVMNFVEKDLHFDIAMDYFEKNPRIFKNKQKTRTRGACQDAACALALIRKRQGVPEANLKKVAVSVYRTGDKLPSSHVLLKEIIDGKPVYYDPTWTQYDFFKPNHKAVSTILPHQYLNPIESPATHLQSTKLPDFLQSHLQAKTNMIDFALTKYELNWGKDLDDSIHIGGVETIHKKLIGNLQKQYRKYEYPKITTYSISRKGQASPTAYKKKEKIELEGIEYLQHLMRKGKLDELQILKPDSKYGGFYVKSLPDGLTTLGIQPIHNLEKSILNGKIDSDKVALFPYRLKQQINLERKNGKLSDNTLNEVQSLIIKHELVHGKRVKLPDALNIQLQNWYNNKKKYYKLEEFLADTIAKWQPRKYKVRANKLLFPQKRERKAYGKKAKKFNIKTYKDFGTRTKHISTPESKFKYPDTSLSKNIDVGLPKPLLATKNTGFSFNYPQTVADYDIRSNIKARTNKKIKALNEQELKTFNKLSNNMDYKNQYDLNTRLDFNIKLAQDLNNKFSHKFATKLNNDFNFDYDFKTRLNIPLNTKLDFNFNIDIPDQRKLKDANGILPVVRTYVDGKPIDKPLEVGATLKDAINEASAHVDETPATSFTLVPVNRFGKKFGFTKSNVKFTKRNNRWYEKPQYRFDRNSEQNSNFNGRRIRDQAY